MNAQTTQKPQPQAGASLYAHGLTRSYGRFVALKAASITLQPNQIHGLIGPNGAGKTTFLRLLAGQDKTEKEGEIWLGSRRVTHTPEWRRARLGLGRSFQRAQLFTDMRVMDNLVLALRGRSFGYARNGGLNFSAGGASLQAQAEEALTEIALVERKFDLVRTLSHGERRLLELAMAFATPANYKPESPVVLLDEPLAGLGAGESAQTAEYIRRSKEGRAILMIEHDLDAIFELADEITVLIAGEAVISGTREEILRDPRVRSAYLPQDTAPDATGV